MSNFFKGIIVGIGGIAPGLSGSVLLVILGLYQKVITAIGTLFKNLKNNLIFLFPLLLGFGVGVIIFSKIINFLLENYEMYTRFAFLGLVLGTIPLFYKEVIVEKALQQFIFQEKLSQAIGIRHLCHCTHNFLNAVFQNQQFIFQITFIFNQGK